MIRSALLPNYRTRNGMHSCNLVKYSISESSDFKDSLWEIIFRAHNFFFFKVHLIEVRSLSYCRIIDYGKYVELTQCFFISESPSILLQGTSIISPIAD